MALRDSLKEIEAHIVESITDGYFFIKGADQHTIEIEVDGFRFSVWMANGEDCCKLYPFGASGNNVIVIPISYDSAEYLYNTLEKEWQKAVKQNEIEAKRKELAALEAKFQKGE